MGTRLTVLSPGTLSYGDACDLQRRTADEVRGGADPVLILLEHPPTFTIGARGIERNLLASRERLASLGADVVQSDRGGDVTYHGPGQVVGYPIVDLRQLTIGVSDFVGGLEQTMIDALRSFGIEAGRSQRGRGVWVGDAKVGAIGVRVSRGITTHGFALNVNTDLSWFDQIVPCGIEGARTTSMQGLLGRRVPLPAVQDALINAFAAKFCLAASERAGVVA